MKHLYLSATAIISIIVIGFFSLNNSGGPNVACSGSPKESGTTCATSCHSDFSLNSGNGSIAITGITTYTPGNVYTLTVTVAQSSPAPAYYGFQGIALTSLNTVAGTLGIIDAGTKFKLISGSNYLEHNVELVSGIWTFQWTAPSTNLGTVTFYFTGVAADGLGGNSGDYVYSTAKAVPAASSVSVTASGSDATCFGACNGTATATASGGTSPYSYLWSNGQNSPTATGLCAGVYTVTASDAGFSTGMTTVTISQPSAISVTLNTKTDVSCNNGNNGSIDINVSGGTTGYSYLWNNTAVTQDISGLSAGTYTITVTDGNSCTSTYSSSVSQPSAITSFITEINASCYGTCDGALSVFGSGGVTPYTYSWSGGLGTGSTKTGVCAGTYVATTTDANGCTNNSTGTVTQPSAIILTATSTDASCGSSNGTATVIASGGLSPYFYSWSNGSSNDSITNLAPGTYTVTVTDANSCSETDSVSVFDGGGLLPVISDQTNVSCNGGNGGIATVSVSGGNSPYTYLWNDGQNTETASGLVAGSYTLIVTDSSGCSAIQVVEISEPPVLALNITTTDVSCNGNCDGTIDALVSGGTSPYSYTWSGGLGTGNTQTGICTGTYYLTITDANNCEIIDSLTLIQSSSITLTLTFVNANCNSADGSASANASGGLAPYSFLWSGGDTTSTISGLAAGTYFVTVTDSNSCTKSDSVTIGGSNAPSISLLTMTNVICNSGNDGFAEVVVTGGNTPYLYLWNNGQSSAAATALIAGTYYLTVTDSNSCFDTLTVIVTEPLALLSTASSTDASCNGICNGTLDVNASGGISPYSFAWSGGLGTGSNKSNVCAGSYFVTTTDANGCTAIDSVSIIQPGGISVSSFATDVTCNGGCNGTLSAVGSGGTLPYTFLWSDGLGTNDSISSVCAGTFTVTLTDSAGCSDTSISVVSQPSALVIVVSSSNANCGSSNGSADAGVSGGSSPYSYQWSGGQTTANITGLAAGSYSVTVTDSNGCTDSASVAVNNNGAPNTSIASQINVSCNGGNDGQAVVAGQGGAQPYTFLWSDGQTNDTAFALSAGNYSVNLSSANGCTSVVFVTITQPNALSLSTSTMDASCNGASNGSVSLSVSGGITPYSYLWNNGQTASTATGLTGGDYFVTVTDAGGCAGIDSATISQSATLITTTISPTDVNCNGGSDGAITLAISGGTSPYVNIWSNGDTTSSLSGLTAGNYTVTVTDANGCSNTDSAGITEPAALLSSVSSTDISCFGGNDGSATITTNGGITPYSFIWGNGETTATITGLAPGNYSVSVTDANGCTTADSATISEPAALSVSVSSTDINCNGDDNGSAMATASGGISPYSYLWNTGDQTQSIDSLTQGTYLVTVTDANACTKTDSSTVSQPSALSVNASSTNASCGTSNGTASASPGGGVSPYSYLWSDGQTTANASGLAAGLYAVTVTDDNGCTIETTVNVNNTGAPQTSISSQTDVSCNGGNDAQATVLATGGTQPISFLWSDGQTTATATGLAAGSYSVVATAADGCIDFSVATISEPPALSSVSSSTDVSCNGGNNGSGSLTISGGTSPYSFMWSNGKTLATINNLQAGNYYVTITDANGCTTNDFIVVSEPPALIVTASSTDASCGSSDGAANAVASGGGTPYSYLWSDGQTTSAISGLAAGAYSVMVTDAIGCIGTASISVNNLGAPNTSISSQTNVNCHGGNDGQAVVLGQGGAQPLSYLWSDGQTNDTAIALTAGNYTVTVSSANGCMGVSTLTITEPDSLSVMFTGSDVSCFNGNDGSASVSISGGVSPYSYLWSTGDTSQTITTLAAGDYSVLVTDNFSCITTQSFTITEPSALTISPSQNNVLCMGGSNGSASVNVSGGTSAYTYTWNPNVSTTNSASNLVPGNYSVTVTDGNNCTATQSFTITEPAALTLSPNQNNVLCNGGSNGSASVIIAGGTSGYTYTWNPNVSTASSAANLAQGNYSVTVTDANNCSVFSSFVIIEPASFSITSSSANSNCGKSDGSATVNVTGATTPYIYFWDVGQTAPTAFNLMAGNHCVTISDANACDTVQCIFVTDNPPPTATTTSTSTTCNDTCNGTATVTGAGGNPPGYYTYSWSNGQAVANISSLCSGIYYVTVTDSMSCFVTDSAIISEPDAISATYSTTPSIDNSCNGSSTVTATGGSGNYFYQWSDSAATSGPTVNNLCGGIYYVTITDIYGCTFIDTVTIADSLSIGLPEMALFSEINIFPNPNSGDFVVELNSFSQQSAFLVIFNIIGDIVHSENISISSGKTSHRISLPENATGIYNVQIQTEKVLINKIFTVK